MKFNTTIDHSKNGRRMTAEEAVKLGMLEVMQRHTHPDNTPVELRQIGKENFARIEEIVEKNTTVTTDEGFNVSYKTDAIEVGFQCEHCDRFLFLKFSQDGKAEMEVKPYSKDSAKDLKYSNKDYDTSAGRQYNSEESSYRKAA